MDGFAGPPGEILDEDPWLAAADAGRREEAEPDDLADAFRLGMRRLAGGVCAVTVGRGPDIVGLTATSVTSLSMAPPSLLVSIRQGARMLEALREARRFTVHLLGEHQLHAAEAFAGRLGPAPRSTLVDWAPAPGGAPRLAGALCHVDCRAARLIPLFSHVVVVGVVTTVTAGDGDRPLVYHGGGFHGLQPLPDMQPTPPKPADPSP
ncbi:flavin reductase family protein [Labrys wisconsinensis]|nr:flavin reductase family protein [Labrys wisconsinensis]